MADVIGISPRTISRKERSAAPLAKAEADRAMRLSRVTHAAVDAIGDLKKAVHWLRKPNTALRGQVPLRLIESEPGTHLVLAALDRIAYGGVV
jgi:putative toxin-antitoxin system antitoxin component (TIGR02293 family)